MSALGLPHSNKRFFSTVVWTIDEMKSEVYQRWEDGFVVRTMRRNEGAKVARWIGIDDQTSAPCELQVLLEMRGDNPDVGGFYVGEIIASLVITSIADDLRYLGLLYVVERFRQSGVARRMITTAHGVEDSRTCTAIVCLIAGIHAREVRLQNSCRVDLLPRTGLIQPT